MEFRESKDMDRLMELVNNGSDVILIKRNEDGSIYGTSVCKHPDREQVLMDMWGDKHFPYGEDITFLEPEDYDFRVRGINLRHKIEYENIEDDDIQSNT